MDSEKITKISSDINELWSSIENNELRKIKETWNGSLSEEYVSKFDNVNETINKINEKLNRLKNKLAEDNKKQEVKE